MSIQNGSVLPNFVDTNVGNPRLYFLLLKPAEQGVECGDLSVVGGLWPSRLLVGVVRGDLNEQRGGSDNLLLVYEDISDVSCAFLLRQAHDMSSDVRCVGERRDRLQFVPNKFQRAQSLTEQPSMRISNIAFKFRWMKDCVGVVEIAASASGTPKPL